MNTTKNIRAPIIACKENCQCPSETYFCNTEQHFCMFKRSFNSSCQHDYQCLTGKCHYQLCRQSCKKDNACSQTKEYCSTTNYCKAKHCGACFRDVQCADHHCRLFYCASDSCPIALEKLQQH